MRSTAEARSLSAEAYEVVRQRIARGELVVGQAVSRRRLAAELGMSFLPVTEALLRLEFEGLLESRPRAGTRVRIPVRDAIEKTHALALIWFCVMRHTLELLEPYFQLHGAGSSRFRALPSRRAPPSAISVRCRRTS